MLMLSNAGTKKERFWVNDDGRRRRRRKILRSRAAPPQAAGSQKTKFMCLGSKIFISLVTNDMLHKKEIFG